MRIYQRILLVAALTIVLTAAGLGAVTYYLSPLAEQAQPKPDRLDEIGDDLPSACLDELAALESTGGKHDLGTSSHEIAGAAKFGRSGALDMAEDDSAVAPNPIRPPATRRNQAFGDSMERGVGIVQIPRQLPSGGATARPIARVQSAEWNESASAPTNPAAAARSVRTATLPVSVVESLPGEAAVSQPAADVLDLMRQLRADSEASRNSARRELTRRGFSEVDLELARQLFNPDATARKQLAIAVPRMASIDAARWLMWLAADPQPEVRIAAITTLATTGDPALLDRVEALARKDADPQVQAIADQIARQHDLSTSRGTVNQPR